MLKQTLMLSGFRNERERVRLGRTASKKRRRGNGKKQSRISLKPIRRCFAIQYSIAELLALDMVSPLCICAIHGLGLGGEQNIITSK